MPIQQAKSARCEAKSAGNTLCITEHFCNADGMPQPPERCLELRGVATRKKAGLRIASAPCCMLPLCARFYARGNRHRLPKQAAHAHAHHHSVAAAHGRVPLSSRFAQHPAGFDVCSIRPFYGNVNTFPAHLCRNDAILTNYTNPPV